MFSISWFLKKAPQDATETRMTWATQELQLQTERNATFLWINLENFEVWSETRKSAIMAGGVTGLARAIRFKSLEGKWRSPSWQRCSSQTHHGWLIKALKSKADDEKALRRYLYLSLPPWSDELKKYRKKTWVGMNLKNHMAPNTCHYGQGWTILKDARDSSNPVFFQSK